MSYKKATYITLFLMLIMTACYYWLALDFQDNRNRNSIGPGYFPIILSVTLTILCIISGLQTAKKQDQVLRIPNIKLIAMSLLATAIFLVSWFYFGFFYISSFVFLVILFMLFNPGIKKTPLLINVSIPLAITAFIYILFGLIIKVRF